MQKLSTLDTEIDTESALTWKGSDQTSNGQSGGAHSLEVDGNDSGSDEEGNDSKRDDEGYDSYGHTKAILEGAYYPFEDGIPHLFDEETLAHQRCWYPISISSADENGVRKLVSNENSLFRFWAYGPVFRTSEGQHLEPYTIPFFTFECLARVTLSLLLRGIFSVLMWHMIENGLFILCIIVIPLFLLFCYEKDKLTFFSCFGKNGYTTRKSVINYAKEINDSPIMNDEGREPFLVAEKSHTEGDQDMDVHTSSNYTVVDFQVKKTLKEVVNGYTFKVDNSNSNELDVESMLSKALSSRKFGKRSILAVESTLTVEIDPDIEELITNELQEIISDRVFVDRAFIVYPNKSYFLNKIMFLKMGSKEDVDVDGDGSHVYTDTLWAVFLRFALGAHLINRLIIWSTTVHCRLDFKVKICSTGGTKRSCTSKSEDDAVKVV